MFMLLYSLHLYSPQVTPGPLYSPWTPSPQPGAPVTSRSTPRPTNSPLTAREGLGGQITSLRSTTSTSSPYSNFFQVASLALITLNTFFVIWND